MRVPTIGTAFFLLTLPLVSSDDSRHGVLIQTILTRFVQEAVVSAKRICRGNHFLFAPSPLLKQVLFWFFFTYYRDKPMITHKTRLSAFSCFSVRFFLSFGFFFTWAVISFLNPSLFSGLFLSASLSYGPQLSAVMTACRASPEHGFRWLTTYNQTFL